MTKTTDTTTETQEDVFNLKAIGEAATEFNRKLTYNLTEASSKTLKDFVSFGEAVTEANTKIAKQYGLSNFAEQVRQLNDTVAKTWANWAGSVNNWNK